MTTAEWTLRRCGYEPTPEFVAALESAWALDADIAAFDRRPVEYSGDDDEPSAPRWIVQRWEESED